MHLFDLKNKTVLITGAASGLGEHFAYLCLSAGAKVIVTARKLKQLDSFKASKNKDVFLLEMDVSLKNSVTDGLEQLEKHHKKIDILIHCAGIAKYTPIFEQDQNNDFEQIIQTNLMGTWYVIKAIAEHMKTYHISGSIIHIGSVNGDATPAFGGAGYNVSRSATMHLTKSLVGELSPHNIRINTISTWMVPTPMTREFLDKNENQVNTMTPLGLAQLDDLDGAILYLASNKASRYVTGSCITVDGGISWGGVK
jgi:NAD(P)-dependent dehydrogenase (short-subunit alcohol dehydrogenase family)